MGKSGSRGNAREREILRKPSAQALTWVEAHRRWVAGHPKFSQGHIANSKITLKQWYASFGSNSTIEDATIHFYNNRKVS